jgi:hypothetical protein
MLFRKIPCGQCSQGIFFLKPPDRVMELLNISNILPFHKHMRDRDPHEENEGVFKKHTLSLAEGTCSVLS